MQRLLIYIDVNTKSLIDAAGNYISKIAQLPAIERGQWQILCIQFMERTEDVNGYVTVTPHKLPSTASYIFVADSDFDDSNPLMLKSVQSTTPFDETDPASNRINIAGDWIGDKMASVSKGQLSIRVNADTVKFSSTMGTNEVVDTGLYACVKQYSNGMSAPSSIARFPFVAYNTVRDWSSPEEEPPDGVQVSTLISAALKNPIEFQFSIDGETDWHSTQTENDMYYRQRVSNIDGEWSEAVLLPKADYEASDIIISAESQFYAGMDVAAALQMIGAELDGLEAELEGI